MGSGRGWLASDGHRRGRRSQHYCGGLDCGLTIVAFWQITWTQIVMPSLNTMAVFLPYQWSIGHLVHIFIWWNTCHTSFLFVICSSTVFCMHLSYLRFDYKNALARECFTESNICWGCSHVFSCNYIGFEMLYVYCRACSQQVPRLITRSFTLLPCEIEFAWSRSYKSFSGTSFLKFCVNTCFSMV